MRHLLTSTLVSLVALAFIGCLPQTGTGSSGGGSSSGSSGDGGVTPATKACLDTADAFARARQRCGDNYDAARAAFLRDKDVGNCDSVTIRNELELRSQCFPALSRISCSDLANNRVAPSCAEQIQPAE